jgi:hypothetical protein
VATCAQYPLAAAAENGSGNRENINITRKARMRRILGDLHAYDPDAFRV